MSQTDNFDEAKILSYIKNPRDKLNLLTEQTLYYLEQFKSYAEHGKYKIRWNWCAALFTTFWFIYRRMYGYAFVIAIIEELLYVIITKYMLPTQIMTAVILFLVLGILIPFLWLGIDGNRLYLDHVRQKINEGIAPPFMGVDSTSVWIVLIAGIGTHS